MARTTTNPNLIGWDVGCQPPLWDYCGVCGGIHYRLGLDVFGRDRDHPACGRALDRWIGDRTEPLPEGWFDPTLNRAYL